MPGSVTKPILMLIGAGALIGSSSALAADAYLRVVDVGAGLCVVAVVPGGHAMLYDAGRGQPNCYNAVRELVPSGRLDLVVLSHSDSDHIRELPAILEDNEAVVIIHPGDPRGPVVDTIRESITTEDDADTEVFNLAEQTMPFGRSFQVGDATVTFVAGWSDGNQTTGPGEPSLLASSRASMRHNALSIVVRFEYGGHSVLLTGDTVGRPDVANNTLCRYSERIMVENAATVPIRSDVLVGQHHGADNSTSNCFIRAVRPEYVVFSAGHDHRHPRQSAVDRLVANGVDPANILRTDRGDHEGGTGRKREWITGSLVGCHDQPGDDDVEIILPDQTSTPITVRYRVLSTVC